MRIFKKNLKNSHEAIIRIKKVKKKNSRENEGTLHSF